MMEENIELFEPDWKLLYLNAMRHIVIAEHELESETLHDESRHVRTRLRNLIDQADMVTNAYLTTPRILK